MYNKSISLTLPEEVTQSLTRAEIVVCDLILDLCRGTSKNSGTGAFYTCVSQKWLANRLSVTREWVSKCVTKLARFGIITITHRRKVGKRYQTNLYRVGDALKKGWKTAKQLFLQAKSRVNFPIHIGTKEYKSRTTIRSKSLLPDARSDDSFDDIMAKCMKRIESFND